MNLCSAINSNGKNCKCYKMSGKLKCRFHQNVDYKQSKQNIRLKNIINELNQQLISHKKIHDCKYFEMTKAHNFKILEISLEYNKNSEFESRRFQTLIRQNKIKNLMLCMFFVILVMFNDDRIKYFFELYYELYIRRNFHILLENLDNQNYFNYMHDNNTLIEYIGI